MTTMDPMAMNNATGKRLLALIRDADYAHPGDLTKRPMARVSFVAADRGDTKVTQAPPNALGRWPANVMHDGSPEVVAGFPTTGSSGDGSPRLAYGIGGTGSGSAARFFGTTSARSEECPASTPR